MCGILGILNLDNRPVDKDDLVSMGERLKHRGPDGSGYHTEGPVGLGQTRLAIIDLEGGKQPIFNEDRTVAVVFNGEIYNFREIRRDLERKGHRFSTNSDTEVIVHLYESYGKSCVHYLRGMFAFALWDSGERILMLARDPLGKKPFYYHLNQNRLVFASEIKSILALKGVDSKMNPAAIDAYLNYQYIPDPMTAFRNIRKLPPGTVALCSGGRLILERYWAPPVAEPSEKGGATEEGRLEEFNRTFCEAVRLRLVSDVPLGAFLSGGIDSSLVVAQMGKIMDRPVSTYSIGFDDPSFDERKEAEEVAKALGTDHRAYVVNYDFKELLPKLIYHFDEPFADSSAIPTYFLSKTARQGVTVALSGDGGDELFAGYRRYVARKLIGYYERIPPPFRGRWIDLLDRWIPEGTAYYGVSVRKKIRLFLDAYHRRRSQGVLLWSPLFTPDERGGLYSPEMRKLLAESQEQDPVAECVRGAETKGLDPVSEMMWIDLQTYLPGDILTKVDRMSMAHGLEVRAPFLDVRLVEQVSRLPLSWKLRGLTTKYLLRKLAKDILPEKVAKRPKRGFAVPLAHWFKGPLKEMIRVKLLDGKGGWDTLFRSDCIERLLLEHGSGRRDHSLKLWGLLIMRLWHAEHAGR